VCNVQTIKEPFEPVKLRVDKLVLDDELEEALGHDLESPIEWLSTNSLRTSRWGNRSASQLRARKPGEHVEGELQSNMMFLSPLGLSRSLVLLVLLNIQFKCGMVLFCVRGCPPPPPPALWERGAMRTVAFDDRCICPSCHSFLDMRALVGNDKPVSIGCAGIAYASLSHGQIFVAIGAVPCNFVKLNVLQSPAAPLSLSLHGCIYVLRTVRVCISTGPCSASSDMGTQPMVTAHHDDLSTLFIGQECL
jgi:hypothetical protein